MKNLLQFITIIIIMSVAVGCTEHKTYRIGVSQCSDDDWRAKMNREISSEIMFHPEATVEIRSGDDSNEKQIADIRYFIENDFDIIIAAPNEADAITPIIKEAYDRGIPVIIFDRSINSDDYTAFQGADNAGLGKSAGEYARHITGPGARMLEIYGLPGSTPAIGRHKGFEAALAAAGEKITASAYGNWNYDDARRVTDSLLEIYPETDLIYAHNDRMAIAASDAARDRGLHPYIIGIDAAPEIGLQAVADSVIDATFLYPTEGHLLIRTAMKILHEEPYDTVMTLPVSSPVDRTNADILLLQSQSLKEESSKIARLKDQLDEFWAEHNAQSSLFYATVTIVALLFVVLVMLLRAYWQRKKYQNNLLEQNRLLEEQRNLQQQLNEQLTTATQSKLMFFTNASHDLRTPLTLITEPVEQLAAATNLTPLQHSLMQIANKNVKILRRLISQILDFRKYENGKLQLYLTEVKPAELMRDWASAFVALARKRDIKLTIDIADDDDRPAAIDAEKIERVFFNLLSNAFKYTPDNGRITIKYRNEGEAITFSVADTGEGIGATDIGNIFDRFYQVDRVNADGSGIGLSLAKAFVELHGGNISVVSEEGRGTTFTVVIPVKHVDREFSAAGARLTSDEVKAVLEAEIGISETPVENSSSDLPLLLVIDDNADVRRMISELMAEDYKVIEAADGREGLRAAARHVPDLIICDVMMPVMDGLECCRLLKNEISTSHIPILMLTACSMDEQRVQGYESGADGYLSKPFSFSVLKARCRSLIENRHRIMELHGNTSSAPAANRPTPPVNSSNQSHGIDSDFYARLMDIITAEMSDPDLNVDTLAAKMSLGRSQFYRKIKALTNYSPVELLRRIRLNTAREMLTTTDKNISEIAYEVGFSTPAYFSRCYREAFGETLSDLRERFG